jgi:hypothetical protein
VKEYHNTAAFYAERGGERSPECDFGVWWSYEGRPFPRYRVSVVHSTGDIYAVELGHSPKVILLAELGGTDCSDLRNHESSSCVYREVERILSGWSDPDVSHHSLAWVISRLGG